MGRPKLWTQTLLLKMPEGMRERIDAVLGEAEDRTAFIRDAIEREIKRRSRKA